ncbi:MAG: NAD-binding protein, partial [Acidobacteria bacterium]|nr:NAD-binding protein [Acidobacteriota bacterium]
ATGMGQAAKLALNLMIAVIYQGFAEGLTLATRQGIAAETFLGLVQSSMVRSGVVDYKAPFVLRRDFSPNFPLRLMHKDIHLMLDAAKELGLNLPALTCVDEIYEEAVRAGQDDLDYAATIALLEQAISNKQ